MSDQTATRYAARAAIAAALITAGVVDLKGLRFDDPQRAATMNGVTVLKDAVDVLLDNVVYK